MPRQLILINPSNFSSPVGSPPGTPVGPPPRSPVARRQRRPIRCSGCRQPGHNIRSCLLVDHAQNTLVIRDRLLQDILVRITRRVPEILAYPVLYETATTSIYLYIQRLTRLEVQQGFLPGSFVINHCYTLIADNLNMMLHNVPPAPAVQHILRGKDYAKAVHLELVEETEEKNECFICCDKTCSVKTACGHEYCSDCVINIIETNKNKTCAPRCAFCCAKFTTLTSSNPISQTHLVDFINNLI